jgi:hypothetical protein
MIWEDRVIEIEIPGFGMVRLEHLVSDFTGTLSVDGKLLLIASRSTLIMPNQLI